jgi:hypothetical protein
VGQYDNIRKSSVSYEWWHLYDLIKNAKNFIKITSFEFSFLSSNLSKCGFDFNIADALDHVIKSKKVNVELWINNTPSYNSMPNYLDATCAMFTCPEMNNYLNSWTSYKNFKINYWYNNPYKGGFPSCKILHAKIYYSDYGLLTSSSNFTPDYWGHTSNTGLCVRFKNNVIPNWIKIGIENIFEILQNNSNKSDYGKKYTCLNNDPNIDLNGAPCGLDTKTQYYNCVGTCSSCNVDNNKYINDPICKKCISN